jgi:hypothetical protein
LVVLDEGHALGTSYTAAEGGVMRSNQHTLMSHDPATGESKPFPSHAAQWRAYHGRSAWLFNPWTGRRRSPEDVGNDVFGFLILPVGETIYAYVPNNVAFLLTDEHINSLQASSVGKLIERAKHAHMTDIKLRINGEDEWYEADWIKRLQPVQMANMAAIGPLPNLPPPPADGGG